MSIPTLFIVRKSSTMYQLFYIREVQTDALIFYKISPAHIAVFKNLDDFTPPHKHSTSILLRHWEGDTILESNWKYTDSKATIERPDGLILFNLPILFFEKATDVLPFKSCFTKTYLQLTTLNTSRNRGMHLPQKRATRYEDGTSSCTPTPLPSRLALLSLLC